MKPLLTALVAILGLYLLVELSGRVAYWHEIEMLRREQMDKCFYCGIVYHPMMRYTNPKKGNYITVCADTIKGYINEPPTQCTEKALADGWVRRPDMTPKR